MKKTLPEWFLKDFKGCNGGFSSVLLTQVSETNTQRQKLGEGRVFELLFRLFHQCLQDGGRDFVVARAHADQTAR